jgi:acyl dehydratase
MAISTEAVGKTYPPSVYAVGREKVREYALAVGETNPLHVDVDVAREAGFKDVVAPPMFCVVYCGVALGPAMFDPEVGIDFARLLHSAQEFKWGPLVVAGDEVTTTLSVKDISARGAMGFYTFESVTTNQHGDTVCVGTWSNIVRGEG